MPACADTSVKWIGPEARAVAMAAGCVGTGDFAGCGGSDTGFDRSGTDTALCLQAWSEKMARRSSEQQIRRCDKIEFPFSEWRESGRGLIRLRDEGASAS